MPKGRMLNKTITIDEELSKLSIETILLYTWCIPHLDIEGRILANTVIIKGTIMPYVTQYTHKLIDKCIDELEKSPLVKVYRINHRYMEFIGFTKNQKLNPDREAPSRIPSSKQMELQEQEQVTQELVRSKSGVSPAKDNIIEVKSSKGKSKRKRITTPEPKTAHIEFVFLTTIEHQKLLVLYGKPILDQYIQKVNNYIGSTGRKYKSHYHVILSWLHNDNVQAITVKAVCPICKGDKIDKELYRATGEIVDCECQKK